MAYLMIVDDDEDFANAVARTLRNAGHEVRVELDPEEAEPSMEQRRPDLVILDVMFPEDSSAGFKFARLMANENDKLKGIPVLMLTAINEATSVGFSSRDIDDTWLPVSNFLEKPVDFAVLKEEVALMLEKAKLRANRQDPQN